MLIKIKLYFSNIILNLNKAFDHFSTEIFILRRKWLTLSSCQIPWLSFILKENHHRLENTIKSLSFS